MIPVEIRNRISSVLNFVYDFYSNNAHLFNSKIQDEKLLNIFREIIVFGIKIFFSFRFLNYCIIFFSL